MNLKNMLSDLILVSRLGATSAVEKKADALLKPARVLFGGRRIYVVDPQNMHVEKERIGSEPTKKWVRVAKKAACVAALPITLLGLLLKLSCRKDESLKQFYATPFAKESTCPESLSEMIRHVHFTKEYVEDLTEEEGEFLFKPLDLRECACVKTGAFNRFKSQRRNNLENAFVQKLVDTVPDKNEHITLLSFGSGGMMSDFITLEKLVLAGFKHISLDCVDDFDQGDENAENINAFFQKFPECQIEVHSYEAVEEVPPVPQGYTAIMAMDCDELMEFRLGDDLNCLRGFLDAYHRLSDNGFAGLGFAGSDLLFRFDEKPEFLYNKRCLKEIIGDLSSQVPEQEKLSLYIDGNSVLDISIFILFSLKLACAETERNYQDIELLFPDKNSPYHQKCFQEVCDVTQQLFPQARVEKQVKQESSRVDLLVGVRTTDDHHYFNMLNPEAPAYLMSRKGLVRKNEGQKRKRGAVIL